jgi:hypothetical protein
MSTYHFNIEQKSTEWFEIKHGKVGGTRAKELFVKTDTLFYKLLAEHVESFDEDFEEGYSSEAMERGEELEPQARIELGKYLGLEFLECGWIQSNSALLGISPDGITSDLTIQCEIKCPQAVAHLKMCVKDGIPLEYIPQCVHAFTVNDKLQKLYFLSYRPECKLKPIFVKELTRESLVNSGTAAKPVINAINHLVAASFMEAEVLESKITETINKLNF